MMCMLATRGARPAIFRGLRVVAAVVVRVFGALASPGAGIAPTARFGLVSMCGEAATFVEAVIVIVAVIVITAFAPTAVVVVVGLVVVALGVVSVPVSILVVVVVVVVVVIGVVVVVVVVSSVVFVASVLSVVVVVVVVVVTLVVGGPVGSLFVLCISLVPLIVIVRIVEGIVLVGIAPRSVGVAPRSVGVVIVICVAVAPASFVFIVTARIAGRLLDWGHIVCGLLLGPVSVTKTYPLEASFGTHLC